MNVVFSNITLYDNSKGYHKTILFKKENCTMPEFIAETKEKQLDFNDMKVAAKWSLETSP